MIVRSMEAFRDIASLYVISIAAGYEDYCRNLIPDYLKDKVCIVPGGKTRFESVKNALEKIPGDSGIDYVAVHDAARPFADRELIQRVYRKAAAEGAAIPVVPLVNSIRRLNCDGSTKAVDRMQYVVIQTPQIFRRDILVNAYHQPFSHEFTDDASVVEAAGCKIYTAEGSPENIKVTFPKDIL